MFTDVDLLRMRSLSLSDFQYISFLLEKEKQVIAIGKKNGV